MKLSTFIQAICHKFEKRLADFYKITQMQSVSIIVHLCPSMLLFSIVVFLLRCLTVSSGYYNASF